MKKLSETKGIRQNDGKLDISLIPYNTIKIICKDDNVIMMMIDFMEKGKVELLDKIISEIESIVDLTCTKLLAECYKGLHIGQEKYGDKSFNRKGNIMMMTTAYASFMRHWLAYSEGNDYCSDDFVHNCAKAINNVIIMQHNLRLGQGDDR